jgi:hypothetical protein
VIIFSKKNGIKEESFAAKIYKTDYKGTVWNNYLQEKSYSDTKKVNIGGDNGCF